jgi:dGTPase
VVELTGSAGYTEEDSDRWLPEQHSSRRSDFARDRARVLHSSALRRLAAKTQVLSPSVATDFARNRLTHSLEVAQVGRELGTSLGLDPDVVDTACLAHDLGHPPFGHNGGFEGNAQTLRLLTRIEPKVFGDDGRSYGLNLTRASLDASCKYPWPASHGIPDPSGRSKFGFYEDDTPAFEWLRAGAPERQRCIEAEVMDLSDDIGYSVHDFEDAIVGSYINVPALGERVDHDALVDSMVEWIGGEFSHDELLAAFDRLDSMPYWIEEWDASRQAHGRLKNLTSQLIGRFAGAAIQATREHFAGSLARFAGTLVVPRDIQAEIAVLKGIVAANVMSTNARKPLYTEQRELLTELADALLADPTALDPGFRADWDAAASDAACGRVIVDQVASLTDQSAREWFSRLVLRG